MYQRIKADKRDDESFSEAVERLVGGKSLLDLCGVFDDEQVETMRTAIETADRIDQTELQDVAERFE